MCGIQLTLVSQNKLLGEVVGVDLNFDVVRQRLIDDGFSRLPTADSTPNGGGGAGVSRSGSSFDDGGVFDALRRRRRTFVVGAVATAVR